MRPKRWGRCFLFFCNVFVDTNGSEPLHLTSVVMWRGRTPRTIWEAAHDTSNDRRREGSVIFRATRA
ncbi:hypothetical protein CLF_100282 [Clonorchis sinensis]|uniref:Secreted protein n=1 Tax=Clonorchis sinensis TaxID=79923 RepID=G7Y337_CLOSI|nr:hypothetical protein CLF_100282 [Clonorchis sinensis]